MLERGHGAGQETQAQQENARLHASLPDEINAATRNLHTSLNRLITSRLPLALPPHTSDPALYATGLVHFAHVFLTFESLWADILRDCASHTPATTSSPEVQSTSPLLSYLLVNPYDSPTLFTTTRGAPTQPSPEFVRFLQTARPRGLLRSARVKKDLGFLLGLQPTDLEVVLAKYPGDRVAEFCTHIRQAVHERPWTLVSYAWCFYMAVFSGGRWIRAGLLHAGTAFWNACDASEKPGTSALSERGLSFWHFPGQFDGEDIKVEFKAQLAAAETLFTPDERIDIIEEAKNIFDFCARLVEELDAVVERHDVKDESCQHRATREAANTEERSHVKLAAVQPLHSSLTGSPGDRVMRFARRPEVAGAIIALGCLACVTLLRGP
ncbi:hypothetical protein FB567DRAFT_227813 [Paraphoma chrysanthemicola]|uniref:Heme oxygenase-like protein n=1 Tax=Paraphoma chrysanthemicola TaxID=798071 RepID=A0A8K0RC91_9PLEO|nr:hypothetical protein FB567DRAFT_227813 [Paraphoma chrysanthemicola]